MTSGMDLKVERVKARTTATDLALRMGVSRQRISQIEALAVVPEEQVERYRDALAPLAAEAQTPVEAAGAV